MKKRALFLFVSVTVIIVSVIVVFSCKKKTTQVDCSKINATYNADVKPIITGNCNTPSCHNAGSINGDFTAYAGLKTKADNGTLNSRVCVQKNMPPSGALSTDNINKISCWVQNSAPNN